MTFTEFLTYIVPIVPIYHVRIKGAGTYEAYGIRVNEDVMEGGAE